MAQKVSGSAGKKAPVQEAFWQGDGCLLMKYPGVGEVLFDIPGYRGEDWDPTREDLTLREQAERHGWGQKIGDLKSGFSSKEKHDMALRQRDAFEAGSWDLTDRTVNIELIVAAVARVMGKTGEQIVLELRAQYKDADKILARVKELRTDPRVSVAMLEISAERKRPAAAASTEPLKL